MALDGGGLDRSFLRGVAIGRSCYALHARYPSCLILKLAIVMAGKVDILTGEYLHPEVSSLFVPPLLHSVCFSHSLFC